MDYRLYSFGENDTVRAFSTQRGLPTGPYSSFNITHYCGDSPEHVARCRAELAAWLGIPAERIVLPRQTHGTEVRAVTASTPPEALEGIDAVMTDEPELCIGISTADCIPLLLFDPVHRAVAAIHAGWRGTVQHIAEKAVRKMQRTYGTAPAHLQAVIGPGISREAFEVGDEVYEAFRQAGFDMTRITVRCGKWHIDLPAANRLQLESAGLKPERIQDCGICTFGNPEIWFSARRLGLRSGRIFTGIMLER